MSTKVSGWVAASAIGATLVLVAAAAFNSYTMPPRLDSRCPNNLKKIGIALEMYACAWGDRRPPLYTTDQRAPKGEAWPDLLVPYLKTIRQPGDSWAPEDLFRCPVLENDRMTYSLNPTTAGLHVAKMKYPSSTICVFDTVSDSPRSNNLNGDAVSRPTREHLPPTGSLVLWPDEGERHYRGWPEWARMRHRGAANILFVDGHVSSITQSEQFTDQYSPHFALKPTWKH